MWKQIFIVLLALSFAFAVLLISVFRTASVKYDFNPVVSGYQPILEETEPLIEYYLPYPGKILPDNPLWPLKALRDRLWLLINTNPMREAELMLLFADKRLGSSVTLFENGNFDDGFSSFTKAEKYLEEASIKEESNRMAGEQTTEFLIKIATASLKHYELGSYILRRSPDDAKPSIIKTQEYSKKTFERSRNALLEKGIDPPENPFDWE